MCAILGVLSKKNFDADLFKEILELMSNRGSDNTGYYFNNHVSLGHKRLAIRDLKNGNQPMFFKDYVIVYNGEIYNTEDIKNDLLNKGYKIYVVKNGVKLEFYPGMPNKRNKDIHH